MMFLPNMKRNSAKYAGNNLAGVISALTLLAVLSIHSGCASTPDRFYIPKPVAIGAGTVLNPTFHVAGFVDLENAHQDDGWVKIGTETHDWMANLNRWTDTAITLLQKELTRRGIITTVNSPTVFELILCPSGDNTLQGHLFVDVKEVGCPLDTDRDGVPDLLDRCPGTPQEAPVNRVGCPLDTDGDGSPNYRDNCPGEPIQKKEAESPKGTSDHKAGPAVAVPLPLICSPEPNRFTVAGPVPPDAVIQLIKKELNTHDISLSESAPNLFTFSLTGDQWREIRDPLELELGKRGVKLMDGPPRILRLSITWAELFWTFYDVGCRLNLSVETGDGRLREYKVSTLSAALYTSCDEAVSKAVAGMFMKERIIVDTDIDMVPDTRDQCSDTPPGVLVDKVGCPLDGDQDGVPDHLDECSNTPKGVRVDDRGCPVDTDGDGVPDFRDDCSKTPADVAVDKAGCPLDGDQDGVPDHVDQCPDTEKGVPVDLKGCRKNPKNRYVLIPDLDGAVGQLQVSSEKGSQVLDKAFEATGLNRANEAPSPPKIMDEEEVRRIFKDALAAQPTPPVHFLLYFVSGTTDLTSQSLVQFPQVLKTIQDRNSVDITVSGHTDRAGSKDYNQKLSLDRAGKVAELLVSKGVNPKILEITSHGEGNPLIKTPDGKAEPKNRRVEIVVR